MIYPSAGKVQIVHGSPLDAGCSLLAQGFNMLWCDALSCGARYFAMLHADVHAGMYWIDTLIREMHEHDAAAVSAVVSLKSQDGLTSTAIDNPIDSWEPLHRLSLEEMADLPETFCGADIQEGLGTADLLINTGCLLIDLDRPWVRELNDDGDLAFRWHIKDRIAVDTENKIYTAYVQPEDWLFSRHLNARGEKIVATTKVRTHHYGGIAYGNSVPREQRIEPKNIETPEPVGAT